MSTEPPDSGRAGHEIPSRLLDAAEFDFSTAVPQPGAVGGLETCAAVGGFTELDCAGAVAAGPTTALRVTVRLAPGTGSGACTREFVELLRALNDLDLALGGRGLVPDRALSAASGSMLIVVLRPLDARWSLDRFRQMAALLNGPGEAQPPPEPSATPDNSRIAEVISLYLQNGSAAGSPRDRIQAWRGRRPWLAGLKAELIPPGLD